MRELPPSSPFAGDGGSADPRLAAALVAFGAGAGSLADVVAALAPARVLVPLLAAGIVALRAPDGRTALPVFSSIATMVAWGPDARPVPTFVPRAAASAVDEGCEILVVDPGGPVTVLVPRPAVRALALGERWCPAVVGGVVDADVRAAVAAALARVAQVTGAAVVPGRHAEVAVVAALTPGLDRTGLAAVLARVNEALAADETVVARVDSLELRLTTAR
ncbi:MAG TPA: SseB family protein [Pengzhenrongella sp.]